MIVQCEECKTNFNLDDKRLRGDSAKVRCSKCKHVFMIYKDGATSVAPPMEDLFDTTESTLATEAPFTETGSFDTGSFDTDLFSEEPTVALAEHEQPVTTYDDFPPAPATESLTVADAFDTAAINNDDFAFSSTDQTDLAAATHEIEPPEPAATESPRASFSDDMLSFADVTPTDEEDATKPVARDEFGFDFAAAEEKPAATFDFDFSSTDEPVTPPPAAEQFDLGGLDFGAPVPEPAKEVTPAPLSFATEDESAPAFIPVPSIEPAAEESTFANYRPFAIAGICATALISMLTTGYFMIKGKPGNMERMGIQNIGSSADAEKGNFTFSSPKAMFIKSKVSGELFVVSGTATNNYTTPRTGVEVQATLFSKTGEELATKSAFCGSSIEMNQLSSMPLAKIEEELTKPPSDDPLENTPVEPGKTTTCIVVFKDVPKQATDYGIEVIHSSGDKLDDF